MTTAARFSVLILALGLLGLPLAVSADDDDDDGRVEVQFGVAGDGVGGTAPGTLVTFPEAFSVPPTIVLTVDESDDNSGSVSCRVVSRSTTDFRFNCFVGSFLQTAFRVHWIAIADGDDSDRDDDDSDWDDDDSDRDDDDSDRDDDDSDRDDDD